MTLTARDRTLPARRFRAARRTRKSAQAAVAEAARKEALRAAEESL